MQDATDKDIHSAELASWIVKLFGIDLRPTAEWAPNQERWRFRFKFSDESSQDLSKHLEDSFKRRVADLPMWGIFHTFSPDACRDSWGSALRHGSEVVKGMCI